MYNSPATFQLMMDILFCELIIARKIVTYIDDILIFTQTMDEHRNIVKQVLQILANNKLLLHPKNANFIRPRLTIWESSYHKIV